MTITVSVEELRGYQVNCVEWAKKRAVFFEKQLTQAHLGSDPFSGGRHIINPESFAKKVAEWEAANPYPLLLPPV